MTTIKFRENGDQAAEDAMPGEMVKYYLYAKIHDGRRHHSYRGAYGGLRKGRYPPGFLGLRKGRYLHGFIQSLKIALKMPCWISPQNTQAEGLL
jgi:hypothetical protein